MKTSDFYGQNIGTFEAKVRHFLSKKSDVFNFRKNALFWRGGKVWNGGRSKRQRDSDRKGVEQHTSCPSAGVSMSSLLLHFLPKSMVFDPHLGETRLFSSELSCNFALSIFFAKISSKSGKVSSSGIELIDKLCLVSDFLSIFAG